MSLSDAARNIEWFRNVLNELQTEQTCRPIHLDNVGAIQSVKGEQSNIFYAESMSMLDMNLSRSWCKREKRSCKDTDGGHGGKSSHQGIDSLKFRSSGHKAGLFCQN